MPPKKKKELVRFRPLLQDERRRQNRFAAKEWASKLGESDKGSYYNQENRLKDEKAAKKPIETTAESSFTSSLAKNPPLNPPSKYKPSGGLFLLEIALKYKVKQSKNSKFPCPIDFETQISLRR